MEWSYIQCKCKERTWKYVLYKNPEQRRSRSPSPGLTPVACNVDSELNERNDIWGTWFLYIFSSLCCGFPDRLLPVCSHMEQAMLLHVRDVWGSWKIFGQWRTTMKIDQVASWWLLHQPRFQVCLFWRTNEHDQIHLMPKKTCELVVVYSML